MGTVRRRRFASRQPFTDTMREFLESGDFRGPRVGFEVYQLYNSPARLEEVYTAYEDTVLPDWVAPHPGTRPWAWWKLRATWPRAVVRGAALLLPKAAPTDWAWVWRGNFGIPAFQQWRLRRTAVPLVESEAAYLIRLGLLRPGEHAALDAEALEPEEHSPFAVDEDELGRLSHQDQASLTTGSALVDPKAIRYALERPPR